MKVPNVLSVLRAHERGPRRDAELAEHGHQEQHLVFTIPEAPLHHRGGRIRNVRIHADLDAKVPHLVLHESQGAEHAAGRRCGRRADLGEWRVECRRHGPRGYEQRLAPGRHPGPGREIAQLELRERVVPRRQVGVQDFRRDACLLPHVLAIRSRLVDGRLETGCVPGDDQPAVARPQ